ncbi:MAG: type II secretion system protein M [Clostridia bacterium]|nr:type II secretion system protein M [Clostridia bacterium]
MKYSFSAREKRLLSLLVGLVALSLWYKVFWVNLWPRYQELLEQQKDLISLEQEIPELMERIHRNETLLSQLNSQTRIIKNRFVPASGLLIQTLGKLAEGKVTIRKIEPESSRTEEYYRVNSLRITCEGPYPDMIRYLQLLEEQTGLRIGTVYLTAGDDPNGVIEALLILEHYQVFREEPVQSITPTTLYEPYTGFNPFFNDPLGERQKAAVEEQEKTQEIPGEDWPLSPYTFPAR